jgi:hypothetical protein
VPAEEQAEGIGVSADMPRQQIGIGGLSGGVP